MKSVAGADKRSDPRYGGQLPAGVAGDHRRTQGHPALALTWEGSDKGESDGELSQNVERLPQPAIWQQSEP